MSTPAAPTSYGELIEVLEALPLLVRETRRRRGLSQRAAGEQVGLENWATISRCESGAGLHLKSIVPLLRWIGTPDAALSGPVPSQPAPTDTQEQQR